VTLDPNVDRQLAELWAVADAWREHIIGGLEAMRSGVRGWEPKPMPTDWHPEPRRRTRHG
jgi:hypothetical protein